LPGITRRLLTLTRNSRQSLAAAILFGVLTGILTIAQAASLSLVVSRVFLGGQSLPDVAANLWLLAVLFLLRALLAWGSEVSAKAVAVKIKGIIRKVLFDKLLRLGPAYSRSERTGELVTTAVEGVEMLDAYFSQYLPQLILAALIPLSILIAVLPHDLLSGFVLLVTSPLIPVFMVLIGKTAEKMTGRQWSMLSRLSAHFFDSLQGLTTLKELGRSREHAASINEANRRFRDATLRVMRVTFLSALVLELVATISTAVVAVEVSLRLLYGQIAFQQAFFLLLLAPEFYIPVRMLGLRFHAGMLGTTAARRIFEILDLPEVVQPDFALTANAHKADLLQKIAFEQVTYFYPGETRPALKDINLEITAGQHIALVGASGAGKTTLARLLLRFIEPTSGHLSINEDPLPTIAMDSWRGTISWVPQNPNLFHDTIAANLRLARPDASMDQMRAAAKAAHLDDFIHSLPHGYKTEIGEQGARLSAGQAQRLALARAFLKDAPLLILDESSSSLDPENEMLVEAAIRDLMRGRTVITIAHRLNTVYRADRIFVLDGGNLVEQGTHRELLEKIGVYSRLVGQAEATPPPGTVPAVFGGGNEPAAAPQPISPEIQSEAHHPSPGLRLLGFLNGSWWAVGLAVLLGVLTVGSNVGLMGTSAFLISTAALHPELAVLQLAIVGVRFFGIARGVFRYAERLASHDVTFRLLARLRTWFYQALEPLAPARLLHYRSGDLLARIVADVENLENFYVRVAAPPLVATVVAVGMVFFLGSFSRGLAAAYLGFLLMLGVGIPIFSWAISRRTGRELVISRAALHTRLVDGIQGLADLLAFDRGGDFAESIAADGKVLGEKQLTFAGMTGISEALTGLLATQGMLVVLLLSIPLVATGMIPGQLLAMLVLSAYAGFEAVLPLPLAAQMLSSSLQSAHRLFEIVDAQPVVRAGPSGRHITDKGTPSRYPQWQVDRLSFSYPNQNLPVLQEVSLQLTPRKKVAIVGPSGSGKTTLVNILLRFWDCPPGKILLDGIDIREFPADEVRGLIGVLSQRTYFFDETIRQNLMLGRPDATEQQMQDSARQAQIHDFILSLPQGYNTIIGERGYRLSGGEQQRLAIARTLLKNAPLLVLDEPTANLDPINEKMILETIINSTGQHTLLFITHRLVEMEKMDEILVLSRGRIVERGKHASLLAGEGYYRRMWELQNRILADGSRV
jgi:ATP-binding cassette, subfamily C, bacterial CydCD